MDKTLDVRFKAKDDDLFHRNLDIRLTSQLSIPTPVRVIDARRARGTPMATPAGPSIFEYYKRPRASTLNRLITEKDEEREQSYELNGVRKVVGNNPLALIEDFNELSYPDPSQLQFLVRTAHAYSDILVLPLVSRITDHLDAGAGFERYLDFLRDVLEIVDTYNRRPVMGVIPLKTPFVRIKDLVEFYTNSEIRALCLDYAGSKPDTARQSAEQVAFSLAQEGVLEETFIYGFNVSSGRPRATTDVSPSHNILSLGYGCDGFGDLHRPRMRIDEGQPPGPSLVRLFSRRDYGEHLVNDEIDLRSLPPAESEFELEQCVGDKKIAKLYNAEQQFLEAQHTRMLINGGRDLPRMSEYLAGKQHVAKHHLSWMKGFGQSRQTFLQGHGG